MAHFIRRRMLATVLAVAAVACSGGSDSVGPEQRPDNLLNLLTVAADAPPLANASVSFWAVKGKNAGTDIWYRPKAGQRDSTKLLEFRLGGSTLDRRPDGSTIADGDSVRITVTVTDPAHLIVDFQPSGLVFSSKDPAKLRMFFAECGDDLDRNGRVDSGDSSVEQQLSIWRRESPLLPWNRLSSAVIHDSKRVDAELGGFSGYALAY
ncbi:MAG TPA: hypothetical protein VGP25_00015 [Gemmatimonadaceae bacterium]|nr:hypothetical protein [Gemmatimonadaceae bacterium]